MEKILSSFSELSFDCNYVTYCKANIIMRFPLSSVLCKREGYKYKEIKFEVFQYDTHTQTHTEPVV